MRAQSQGDIVEPMSSPTKPIPSPSATEAGPVTESPIAQLLEALDRLDLDAALALFAPGGRVLVADGRRARGAEAIRLLMASFLGQLRCATHRITAQWNQEDAWIAEVEVSYELKDWLRLGALPRAFIARTRPEGISELHVYGAHEHRLSEHPTGEEGMWIGGRWIPPL